MKKLLTRFSRSCHSSLECLESRIAPAAVLGAHHAEVPHALATDSEVTIVNPHNAQFIDQDGDLITIRVSKGTLTTGNFMLEPAGDGHRLAFVDLLQDHAFSGTNLSFFAKRQGGGDGLVNIGRIDATGLDLGVVAVSGDLLEIDAGDAMTKTAGLRALRAVSMGKASEPIDTVPQSEIVGPVGQLTVLHGMFFANLNITGEADGRLGAVNIHGGMSYAALMSTGSMGTVSVVGTVNTGGFLAGGSISSVTIQGSAIDTSITSGEVIGRVKITGDFTSTSASVISAVGRPEARTAAQALAIGSVWIGGSTDFALILAGYSEGLGVNGNAGIGSVYVGFNWLGSDILAGAGFGDDSAPGTLDDTMLPNSSPVVGRIGSITIVGSSLTSNFGPSDTGFVAGEIGTLKIGRITLPLHPGAGNDLQPIIAGNSSAIHVREVIAMREG